MVTSLQKQRMVIYRGQCFMLKTLTMLVALGACTEDAVELEPYACRAQIECLHQDGTQMEVFHSGFYGSKQDAKDVFGPIIHQRGLGICYPELYNTKIWDCEKIPFCSELGC